MKPLVLCELQGITPITIDGEVHLVAYLHRLSDHPKLGRPRCESTTRTSMIVRVDAQQQIIETLNTRYRYLPRKA